MLDISWSWLARHLVGDLLDGQTDDVTVVGVTERSPDSITEIPQVTSGQQPSERASMASTMVSLVVRHHLETWLTGMYLLLGGEEAFEKFVGATRRSDDAQRNAIAQLQAKGGLGAYELAPPENTDWEPAHWKYEDVAREVDRLAGELELLRGGRAAYQIGYRSFSGRLGAHPTWRLLNTYTDSTTGTVQRRCAERVSCRPGVRCAPTRFSSRSGRGHFPAKAYSSSVPTALIAIGAVLIVFTFLAAFTIYGELSAVAGVVCIAIGAVLLGRRSSGRGAGQPHRH